MQNILIQGIGNIDGNQQTSFLISKLCLFVMIIKLQINNTTNLCLKNIGYTKAVSITMSHWYISGLVLINFSNFENASSTIAGSNDLMMT